MRYRSTLQVFDNPELAYQCFVAEKDKKSRFELNIVKKKECVELVVDADDATALRAINTSMVALLNIYEKLK